MIHILRPREKYTEEGKLDGRRKKNIEKGKFVCIVDV